MSKLFPSEGAVGVSEDAGQGDVARPRRVRLTLRRGRPLREGMVGAFQSILAVTRRTAAAASTRPVEAVHEFRKSIRRARAIVELLRPALGGRAADGLVLALKKAVAETGSLRDADILWRRGLSGRGRFHSRPRSRSQSRFRQPAVPQKRPSFFSEPPPACVLCRAFLTSFCAPTIRWGTCTMASRAHTVGRGRRFLGRSNRMTRKASIVGAEG